MEWPTGKKHTLSAEHHFNLFIRLALINAQISNALTRAQNKNIITRQVALTNRSQQTLISKRQAYTVTNTVHIIQFRVLLL